MFTPWAVAVQVTRIADLACRLVLTSARHLLAALCPAFCLRIWSARCASTWATVEAQVAKSGLSKS